MIIDVYTTISDHIRKYSPDYDWNKDPLCLTLLQSKLYDQLHPNIDPGWSEKKWISFYNGVKPFMYAIKSFMEEK